MSMPRMDAIVAILSPRAALSMIMSANALPSSTAFFAAFSSPVVILLTPSITCPRLIFLLIPWTLAVS